MRKFHLKKRESGFTLIELMVVVAIIAILAAIGLQQYIKYIKRSRTTEAIQHGKMLYAAVIDWYNTPEFGDGAYPTSPASTGNFGMTFERVFPVVALWWSNGDGHYNYVIVQTTGSGLPPLIRAEAKDGMNSRKVFADIVLVDPLGNVFVDRVSDFF